MRRRKKRNSDVFESIMEGLKQAVAYSRGEPVEGVRVHHFERLPDGTVRRIEDASDAPSPRWILAAKIQRQASILSAGFSTFFNSVD